MMPYHLSFLPDYTLLTTAMTTPYPNAIHVHAGACSTTRATSLVPATATATATMKAAASAPATVTVMMNTPIPALASRILP